MKADQFNFMIESLKKGFALRVASPLRVYLFNKKNASVLKNSDKDGFFIKGDYVAPFSCGVQMATDRVLYAFDWNSGEWKKIKDVGRS